MKKFTVGLSASENEGEYVLGVRDTGTHACYMIYGTLEPGEKDRLICPGKGHEEIVVSVNGNLEVSGGMSGTINPGEAFLVQGDVKCFLENKSEGQTTYIASGGHTPGAEH